MKNFTDAVSSPKGRWTIGVVGALVLALLIFHAGVVVGSHRGQFGRSDMNRGFRPSFLPEGFELPHGFIPNTHGAVGEITAVTLPNVTMKAREGTYQTILVSTSTVIRSMDSTDTKSLSVGNKIIVLGEPDGQGRINATLIRILSAATSTP